MVMRLELIVLETVDVDLSSANVALSVGAATPTMVLEFAPALKGKDAGAPSATAMQPLSGHIALAYESSGGVVPLDVLNPIHGHGLAGISNNAASAGSSVELLTHGHLSHNGWQFDAGKPVFVGVDGVLTQAPAAPPLAVWRRCVGVALNATTLAIDFQPALFYQEV